MAAQLLRLLLLSTSICMWSLSRAGTPADPNCAQTAPIPEDEQQQIAQSLLGQYPLLAFSPGVKAGEAHPTGCPHTSSVSVVVFHPHSEHRGVKEAYEALCEREYGVKTWRCDHVSILKYLKLSSQDHEVRVEGDIASEAAFAIVEASRRGLHAARGDVKSTAMLIRPNRDGDGGYHIYWRHPNATVLARVTEGGDPANPDAWHTSIWQ